MDSKVQPDEVEVYQHAEEAKCKGCGQCKGGGVLVEQPLYMCKGCGKEFCYKCAERRPREFLVLYCPGCHKKANVVGGPSL